MVCQDVELKGDITIGSGISFPFLFCRNTQLNGHLLLVMPEGTIVHPKATIFAIAGPIVIGTNCIVEEAAIIVNR